MPVFAEVAINLPQISDAFHDHLPADLTGAVAPGSLVIVPFGKQRVQGIVLRTVDKPEVSTTKPVEELVNEKPALTPAQIKLADWMSEETLAPLGACISQMLPAGLSQRTDTFIRLNQEWELDEAALTPIEKRLVHLLQERGDLRGRQVDASIRHVEWRGALRKLAKKGIVHTRAILPPPRVSPKTVRKVSLSIPPDEIETLETPLSARSNVPERRMKIL